jgi:hypothetical protein
MPPTDKATVTQRQDKLLGDIAIANGVSKQQALDAMLALGAKAFAADANIVFSSSQAQEMKMAAHESSHVMQSTHGTLNSNMTSAMSVIKSLK